MEDSQEILNSTGSVLSPASGLKSTRCQADSIQLPRPKHLEEICSSGHYWRTRRTPAAIECREMWRGASQPQVARPRARGASSIFKTPASLPVINVPLLGWLGKCTTKRGEIRLSVSNLNFIWGGESCPMFLGERAFSHLNAMPRPNTDLQSPANGLAAFTETAKVEVTGRLRAARLRLTRPNAARGVSRP